MRSLVVCIFVLSSNAVLASPEKSVSSDVKTHTYTGDISSTEHKYLGYIAPSILVNAFPEFNHNADQQVLLSRENKISSSFINNAMKIDFQPSSQLLFTYNKVQLTPETYQDWDWQNEKVNLHYFHLSEKLSLTAAKNTWLYTGIGFTFFESQNNQYENDAAMSVNVGINASFELNQHASISIDSKVYGTFMENDLHRFCANEACSIDSNEDVWLQQYTSLQLKVTF